MLWLALAAGLGAAVLSLLIIAYGPRLGYDLREPTAEEREHLAGLRGSVGPTEATLKIRESTDGTAIDCDLLGLPGRRLLVVADGSFDGLPEEELRALLAVQGQRDRSLIDVQQALAAGIAVGVFASVYVAAVPILAAFLTAWALALIGIALARRRYFAADEAAAATVDRAALQRALEESASSRDESLDSEAWWRAFLDVEPSLVARVDRLEYDPAGES